MANPTTTYFLADGRLAINVTENKTLALADCGIVQNVIADGVVVTLPATAAGFAFIVRNGGVKVTSGPTGAVADGSAVVKVSPAAADQISGVGLTPADDKDLINTKATSKVGDEVTLISETNGYTVSKLLGTWARE
ncbi:MAG: hypothetical protein Q8910_01620 [Bacteroidota bacterium]|nr:hypothetical protein [Bacteroidota bacterium]